MAETTTIYMLRDYLELSSYGGQAFAVSLAASSRAYWFDNGTGAPSFSPPYDTANTAIQAPSASALNNACGLYALIESCTLAMEADGHTVTYTPVGGVAKEKWTITFADDIAHTDVWNKELHIYSPAQPAAPGFYPQLQDVYVGWYESAPGIGGANSDYWTGSPPSQGLFYGQDAQVQIASGDTAYVIADKTKTAIEAVTGPASEAVFTCTLNPGYTTGGYFEMDFTSFDPSALSDPNTWMYFWSAALDGDPSSWMALWASWNGSGPSPTTSADVTVEVAFVTGDSASDMADKTYAVLNASPFTAWVVVSQPSANVVRVQPDTGYDAAWMFGSSPWVSSGSLSYTNYVDGSSGEPGDAVLTIECIKESPTVPWVKHSTNGPGSKVTLTQVTAGTYHEDDHLFTVDAGAEMLAPPEHLTTDDDDLLFDELPPGGPITVNADPAVLELLAPAATITKTIVASPAVLELVAPAITITKGLGISPAVLELVAPDATVSLSVDTTRFLYGSRVEETATCVGTTDPYVLGGAISAEHKTFADEIGLSIETEYYAVATGKWERGYGVPLDTRLVRHRLLDSSTGSRIAWSGSDVIRVRCVRGPTWLHPVVRLTSSPTTYAATLEDGLIVWNPGSATCTLTLLDPDGLAGAELLLKLDPAFASTGTVAATTAASGADIEGGSAITLTAAGDFVHFRCDGTRWLTFAKQVT